MVFQGPNSEHILAKGESCESKQLCLSWRGVRLHGLGAVRIIIHDVIDSRAHRVCDTYGVTPHEPRRGWLRAVIRQEISRRYNAVGPRTGVERLASARRWQMGDASFTAVLSTGPKTLAGVERIRPAVTKHGKYPGCSTERQHAPQLLKKSRELLSRIG